jgi:GTP cyclohydrolase I
MRSAIAGFLRSAGLPCLEGELRRTPERTARAWRDHLLKGYEQDPAKILEPLRASRSHDVVAVREMDFASTCVHHLLPFHGKVHLAYLPAGRIVGVSRLAALVDCLSRRLQVQEELTEQIAAALQANLGARGAACVVEATHLCMAARGERSSGGRVVTASFVGCYETDGRQRAQVLALLGQVAGRPARSRGRSRGPAR